MNQTDPFFREALLSWAKNNPRPLPWKGERDPYRIWLSEIILQQTRVEQGAPYYEKFIRLYPDVRALAAAPEDELFKHWEGLGYYSRARNLHAAAKFIAEELQGVFPQDYKGIRALKGVGDYTAAAVASFAFGLPHAVLDGNVYRVLSRFSGIKTPVDTPEAGRIFSELAHRLLDRSNPGRYNQAIMDFGALQCKPQNPRCADCPLSAECIAFRENAVANYPVKSKSIQRKSRFFVYLDGRTAGQTLLRKRTGRDIWKNLYEFPQVEVAAETIDAAWIAEHFFGGQSADFHLVGVSKIYRQTLTHRQVAAVFCRVNFEKIPLEHWVDQYPAFSGCRLEKTEDLKKKFAFPRLIDWYLSEKAVPLSLIPGQPGV